MKTGKILNKGKHGHTLHAGSFAFMFTNKDQIFKLLEKATSVLLPISTDIISLQRAFIFDEETQYPFSILLVKIKRIKSILNLNHLTKTTHILCLSYGAKVY